MKKKIIIILSALLIVPSSISIYWVAKITPPLRVMHFANLISAIPEPCAECYGADGVEGIAKEIYRERQNSISNAIFRKYLKFYTLHFRGDDDDMKALRESVGISAVFMVQSVDPTKYEVAQFLLDKGADINQRAGNRIIGPDTALQNAIYNNNPTDVKWLLSRGADPKIPGIATDKKISDVIHTSDSVEFAQLNSTRDGKDRTKIIELLNRHNGMAK